MKDSVLIVAQTDVIWMVSGEAWRMEGGLQVCLAVTCMTGALCMEGI